MSPHKREKAIQHTIAFAGYIARDAGEGMTSLDVLVSATARVAHCYAAQTGLTLSDVQNIINDAINDEAAKAGVIR